MLDGLCTLSSSLRRLRKARYDSFGGQEERDGVFYAPQLAAARVTFSLVDTLAVGAVQFEEEEEEEAEKEKTHRLPKAVFLHFNPDHLTLIPLLFP